MQSPQRRLGRSRAGTGLAGWLALAFCAPASAQPNAPSLTLVEALARASSADPAASAAEARLVAAQAALRQAGVRLNPSITGDLENFVGTGPYSLLDRVEATVAYEQVLERGGKRQARTDRARAEIEVVRLRRQVRRLDLLERVQTAYAEVLAAEADLLIAEARLIASQRSQTDIERRVSAARDPLFAGSRAEALTALAEITRDQARVTARNARAALTAFWGGPQDFGVDLSDFSRAVAPVVPPPADTADVALLAAERDVAIAAVQIERSRTVTDPRVRAGLRYLGDGTSLAFVVGGSIPLQRYNTNRAGIQRAQAERTAAEADIAAARAEREREIARLTARLAASVSEAERIRAEVIPVAERTVTQVREGFNRGGFAYIDVTEAERALADARSRRGAMLRQYHLDQARLDRLTGRHAALLSTLSNAETR